MFSFGPRRRTSVSLPRNNDPSRDPFEKADRHERNPSRSMDFKGSAMNQGQRVRYLKTGGIIAFILLILYFIAPRDSLSRTGGTYSPGYCQPFLGVY